MRINIQCKGNICGKYGVCGNDPLFKLLYSPVGLGDGVVTGPVEKIKQLYEHTVEVMFYIIKTLHCFEII